MTNEEAKQIIIDRGYIQVEGGRIYDGDKWREAIYVISKMFEGEQKCEDCISRQAVLDCLTATKLKGLKKFEIILYARKEIKKLPPVPRKGQWLRMSDLSEQEDDRYKCSRCGNVIHYKNKMNLYTFNSWCGRCGSDNGRN